MALISKADRVLANHSYAGSKFQPIRRKEQEDGREHGLSKLSWQLVNSTGRTRSQPTPTLAHLTPNALSPGLLGFRSECAMRGEPAVILYIQITFIE
jgi:hypothetical protein